MKEQLTKEQKEEFIDIMSELDLPEDEKKEKAKAIIGRKNTQFYKYLKDFKAEITQARKEKEEAKKTEKEYKRLNQLKAQLKSAQKERSRILNPNLFSLLAGPSFLNYQDPPDKEEYLKELAKEINILQTEIEIELGRLQKKYSVKVIPETIELNDRLDMIEMRLSNIENLLSEKVAKNVL